MASTDTMDKIGGVEVAGVVGAAVGLGLAFGKIAGKKQGFVLGKEATLNILTETLQGHLASEDWSRVPEVTRGEVEPLIERLVKLSKLLEVRLSLSIPQQVFHAVKYGRFEKLIGVLRGGITDLTNFLDAFKRVEPHHPQPLSQYQAAPAICQHHYTSTPVSMNITLNNCHVTVTAGNAQAHGKNHGQFPSSNHSQLAYEQPPTGYPPAEYISGFAMNGKLLEAYKRDDFNHPKRQSAYQFYP